MSQGVFVGVDGSPAGFADMPSPVAALVRPPVGRLQPHVHHCWSRSYLYHRSLGSDVYSVCGGGGAV